MYSTSSVRLEMTNCPKWA